MKTIKSFIILMLLTSVLSQISFAQSFDFPLKSNNQQLIEDAVRDGLFIVERSYQLKDKKGKLYGWNESDHFGQSRSLGVKVEGGFVLSDKAVNPWLYDAHYDDYSANADYTPVVSESVYAAIGDSTTAVLPYKNIDYKPFADGKFYLVADSVFAGKGFLTDDSCGLKKGWLVWLVADEKGEYDMLIYRREADFGKSLNTVEIDAPSTTKTIVGGVFFVPTTTATGQITFVLSGLAVERDNQWLIAGLGKPAEEKPAATEEKPKTDGKGRLTPVSKKKK